MKSNDSSTSTSPSTSTSTSKTTTAPQQRRKRILLGITGSVAAIKGPEIALLLSRELDAHVVVLLTHGGSNFWYKAKDYNPLIWEEYENFIRDCDLNSNIGSGDGGGDGDDDGSSRSLPGVNCDDRSIVLFSKFLSYNSNSNMFRTNDITDLVY